MFKCGFRRCINILLGISHVYLRGHKHGGEMFADIQVPHHWLVPFWDNTAWFSYRSSDRLRRADVHVRVAKLWSFREFRTMSMFLWFSTRPRTAWAHRLCLKPPPKSQPNFCIAAWGPWKPIALWLPKVASPPAGFHSFQVSSYTSSYSLQMVTVAGSWHSCMAKI